MAWSTPSAGGCGRRYWTSLTRMSFAALWMEGAGVLYNTYWVRFGRGRATFDQAVQNARILFEAAARADVGRMVRFSVANTSTESRLTYFRGKGLVEEILKDTGIPYAIISPTLVFGQGDLPLNNMDWRCGVFRSSPFSGAVIIQCSSFMLRTWQPWRWRLVAAEKI